MMYRICIVFAGLWFLVGCGDGKPKADLPPLHPVTGKILQGGVAVASGSIQFAPVAATAENRDLSIMGSLKSDGTFQLETLHALSQKKAAGAPPGDYQVTYTPQMGDQTKVSMDALTPIILPQPYTVKAGSNDFTIDIGAR